MHLVGIVFDMPKARPLRKKIERVLVQNQLTGGKYVDGEKKNLHSI